MNHKRNPDVDWSPLKGIAKHPNATRGVASFTHDEAERIRTFYLQSGVPARMIAERLEVSRNVIERCIYRDVKGVRRNITGKRKAWYWREKAKREKLTAWNPEACE